MSVEKQVLRAMRHLSAERRRELADFADFLAEREKRESSVLEKPEAVRGLPPLPEFPGKVPAGWKDAIYAER